MEMELVFKVCLIIANVIILTVTDSKVTKVLGVVAITLMCISFLRM